MAVDHHHAWNDDDAPGGAGGNQREVKDRVLFWPTKAHALATGRLPAAMRGALMSCSYVCEPAGLGSRAGRPKAVRHHLAWVNCQDSCLSV
jgi:hypothetical protein